VVKKNMRQFPFAAMALILIAGVCFIFFIVFNYAYDNPDNGLFNLLEKSAEKTMNADKLSWFGMRLDHIRTGFGLSALVLFSLAILIFVVKSFDETPG
jgi:hypothetical protein